MMRGPFVIPAGDRSEGLPRVSHGLAGDDVARAAHLTQRQSVLPPVRTDVQYTHGTDHVLGEQLVIVAQHQVWSHVEEVVAHVGAGSLQNLIHRHGLHSVSVRRRFRRTARRRRRPTPRGGSHWRGLPAHSGTAHTTAASIARPPGPDSPPPRSPSRYG